MPDAISIGPTGGLKTNPQAFNIDNNSFPTLYNMYVWRNRAKRKRGTLELARLQRTLILLNSAIAGLPAPTGGATYTGNLITAYAAVGITFPLASEPGSQIAPGFFKIWFDKGLGNETLYVDDGAGGFIKDHGPFGFLSGTVNYITGAFTINFGGTGFPGIGVPVSAIFSYFPSLPVMGLEDYVSNTDPSQFPLLMAFDTRYSYQINQVGTPFFYNTNFYKISDVEFTWHGGDYQQFWTTNYQSAFWATNNNPGLHLILGTYVAGSATNIITFTFVTPSYSTPGGVPFQTLVIGDKLWFNEWPEVVSPLININGLVGTVSDITLAAAGTYQVTFTTTPTVSGTGIVQMLTNSLPDQDGIKWYDGDPTSGTGLPTGIDLGWVNFAPPLTALVVSINDQVEDKYYLVGALAILPFKDRLLFFKPQVMTSAGVLIDRPLQDTVLWSWNGTPYYNSLVPTNVSATETFDVSAYYVDQTGKGGYLPAGISQPLVTVMNNEDVLLIGFGGAGKKTRFVYTGNDLQPFTFYLINSELPSSSTFSAVILDRGGIDIGTYGTTITTQQSTTRIDMDIPDEIFTISAANNGQERVNAIRDFFRQWIYFSYPVGDGDGETNSWRFPTQSFLLNYQDNTWAILYENFTHHGTFRKNSEFTWETLPYNSWDEWNEPWNSGTADKSFPSIVGGTPQGYVVVKGEGTGEAPTGAVFAIADDGMGDTQITSIDHCVAVDDYLYFTKSVGAIFINGLIGRVISTPTANVFVVDIKYVTSTYTGAGVFTRLSQPLLQTKQFPVYWAEGRQVRIGTQRYLFDVTTSSQVTIGISLSQDPENFWNDGPIVPEDDVLNASLVYSQTVFTCPESTNLGLTPANSNLQQQVGANQKQMWHRVNTSLQGDTFQVGLTLSDAQMRNLEYATSEIALHGMNFQVYRGPLLA